MKAMLQEPQVQPRVKHSNLSRARLAAGKSERCHNPLCNSPIEPLEDGWRRTERRYCSDTCRQQTSIIKRAAKLLISLSDEKAIEILRRQNEAK